MQGVLNIAIGFVVGAFIAPFVKPWTRLLERLGRRLFAESPVIVNLERDQSVIWAGAPPWVGYRTYFPQGLPDEPEPDAAVDWHAWAVRNGGIDVGLTMVQVTIQAKLDVSVVLGTPIVRIVDTADASTAGVMARRLTGGADLTPRRYEIELGITDPPLVYYINDEAGENTPPPSFRLAAGDAEQLQIWAKAHDNTWYDWTITLPVIVDGVRKLVNLTDDRGPLSTVGDNSDDAGLP